MAKQGKSMLCVIGLLVLFGCGRDTRDEQVTKPEIAGDELSGPAAKDTSKTAAAEPVPKDKAAPKEKPAAKAEEPWDYTGWRWAADEDRTYRFAIPAGSINPLSINETFAEAEDKTIVAGGLFRATTPDGHELMVQVGQPSEPFKSEEYLKSALPVISEMVRTGGLLAQETLDRKMVPRAGGLGVQFLYKSDWNPLDVSAPDGEYRVAVRIVQTAGKEFIFTVAAAKEKFAPKQVEQLLDSLRVAKKSPG